MVIYKKGDILLSGAAIIGQQVNCKGVMGAGLAKQIRDKHPVVYRDYKEQCASSKGARLGDVQFCYDANTVFANLFAQDGYGRERRYTDYYALRVCLRKVLAFASKDGEPVTVALPYKLGCGLAGGDWNVVKAIIEEMFERESCVCEIWEFCQ